jgi:hypothetical protein
MTTRVWAIEPSLCTIAQICLEKWEDRQVKPSLQPGKLIGMTAKIFLCKMPHAKVLELLAEFQAKARIVAPLIVSAPIHFEGVEAFKGQKVIVDHLHGEVGVPLPYYGCIDDQAIAVIGSWKIGEPGALFVSGE